MVASKFEDLNSKVSTSVIVDVERMLSKAQDSAGSVNRCETGEALRWPRSLKCTKQLNNHHKCTTVT